MMPFTKLTGIAAPLLETNIDTDKIIPAEFLKTISRTGLAKGLLATMRRDPAFVLNNSPWDKAKILVALENFGCGSSREHAPWALLDFGIRCIIAPSFADIFYNNCFKNGILPVILPRAQVDGLIALVTEPSSAWLEVDLEQQLVIQRGTAPLHFQIDLARKHALISGLDEIARTLEFNAQIDAYETARQRDQPWFTWIPQKFPIDLTG